MVVVEEEDTTREMRRLKSTLAKVMKQIKVSTASGILTLTLDIGVRHCHCALTGDNSDYRAVPLADQKDGAPHRGERKIQGGDEPHGEKHPIGTESDQLVNICSFVVRCDRRWPSTK